MNSAPPKDQAYSNQRVQQLLVATTMRAQNVGTNTLTVAHNAVPGYVLTATDALGNIDYAPVSNAITLGDVTQTGSAFNGVTTDTVAGTITTVPLTAGAPNATLALFQFLNPNITANSVILLNVVADYSNSAVLIARIAVLNTAGTASIMLSLVSGTLNAEAVRIMYHIVA